MSASVIHLPTSFPPGVRDDLTNEQYHGGPGISNSGLNDMARSPAHFYSLHRAENRPPKKEKAGQLEGNLCHCATLEPAEFDKRYVVKPENAPNRPTARQWNAKSPSSDSVAAMKYWTEFEEEHAGKRVITAEQYDVAFAQAEQIRKLPEVAKLMAVGWAERSAYWIDPITGALCRCRPDFTHPVNDTGVILVDLKTYSDASPREFTKQISRKGYHRQDAWYSDGYAHASGLQVFAFIFVAVETEYPYKACAFQLDPESQEKGRAANRALLDRYAECEITGVWPSYSEGIELITLPSWVN